MFITLLFAFVVMLRVSPAQAQTLQPGDIVGTVIAPGALPPNGSAIKIDGGTGQETVLATGLNDPQFVTLAYDAAGSVTDIFVSETLGNTISRIDPEPPHTRSVVASASTSPLIYYPRDLVVDGNGDLLVAEDVGSRILRVTPTTGAVSIVSTGGLLHTPISLAIEQMTGNLLVADPDFNSLGQGAILRVDPSTGAQSEAHLGPFAAPYGPFGLDMAANGDAVLLELSPTISRIDLMNPTPLGRTVISVGGLFMAPWTIALDQDENILVGDYQRQAIIRVDAGDGSQTIISTSRRWSGVEMVRPPTVVSHDEDDDGVLNDVDQCLGTAPGATVDGSGCSIDQIVPCDGDWRNHGDYVSAVSTVARSFRRQGLIDQTEVGVIVREAARSSCGF